MRFFVTKYALTSGILVKHGEVCHNISDEMISIGGGYGSECYHKPFWHESLEEARAQVQKMKDAKVASLRKQLAKLEHLDPSRMVAK